MTKNIIIVLVIIVIIAGGYYYFKKSSSSDLAPLTNSQVLEKKPDSVMEVESSDISYFENAKGYFAHPKKEERYPGVVMIHEWWGLNDTIRDTARQLAGEGYVVLAVDLYNGEVADTQERAQELKNALKQEDANENLKAAVSYLRQQNAEKIASLGWCFGGGQSLQLALSGEKLDGTIIYYGNLVSDKEQLSKIEWPVLGIFGDQDKSISVESVQTFDKTLDEVGVENEIHIYPGVGHAFANPSGASYAPDETKDAWEKTLSFLKRTLQ